MRTLLGYRTLAKILANKNGNPMKTFQKASIMVSTYVHAIHVINSEFLLYVLVFSEDSVEMVLRETGPAIQDSTSEGLVEVVLYEADATKENSSGSSQ